MSDRILLATRKGLFRLIRGAGRWRVESPTFLGAQVLVTEVDPRDGVAYAGVGHGHFGPKMHRSRDGGRTFEEVATPKFAEAEGASVKTLFALATDTRQPGWVWCGTIPGALFHSEDAGASWSLVRGLWDHPTRPQWFGGGTDQPALHSIEVDPRDPRRVTIGISCAGVWETRDGGGSWRNIGEGLRAEYMPPEKSADPLVQDPHMLKRCDADPDVIWMQHHNGVFRSEDSGHRWTECAAVEPSAFGFPIAADPTDRDVAWTVPGVKDEVRVAVDGALCVSRTEDGGRTWRALREGLPQEHAYDIPYRHALDVSADGRRLCFGTISGNVYISEDRGESWQTVGTGFPLVHAVEFY